MPRLVQIETWFYMIIHCRLRGHVNWRKKSVILQSEIGLTSFRHVFILSIYHFMIIFRVCYSLLTILSFEERATIGHLKLPVWSKKKIRIVHEGKGMNWQSIIAPDVCIYLYTHGTSYISMCLQKKCEFSQIKMFILNL